MATLTNCQPLKLRQLPSSLVRGRPSIPDIPDCLLHTCQISVGGDLRRHGRRKKNQVEAAEQGTAPFDRKRDCADAFLRSSHRGGVSVLLGLRDDTFDETSVLSQRRILLNK